MIVVAALFLALLAYGLSAKAPDDTIDRRLDEGRTAPAPGFSLEFIERVPLPPPLVNAVSAAGADGRLSLEEVRGTPVVINFWASWCSPCKDEAPALEQTWKRWGPRGVLFVGIDMQDLRDDARRFVRDQNVTYPMVRDPDREVATDYGATGIPETYFVTGSGRVVGHVVGVVSEEQLESGVAAARAGRVAGKTRGGAIRKPR